MVSNLKYTEYKRDISEWVGVKISFARPMAFWILYPEIHNINVKHFWQKLGFQDSISYNTQHMTDFTERMGWKY